MGSAVYLKLELETVYIHNMQGDNPTMATTVMNSDSTKKMNHVSNYVSTQRVYKG